MSEITHIDSARPHTTKTVVCGLCEYKWVAVFPTAAKALECPNCHDAVNEEGIAVFVNKCKTCGREYSVCPKPENIEDWQYCMSDDCASYDEKRDADHLFEQNLVKREDDMTKDQSINNLIGVFLTGDQGEDLVISSPLINDNGQMIFETMNMETGQKQRVTFRIEEI